MTPSNMSIFMIERIIFAGKKRGWNQSTTGEMMGTTETTMGKMKKGTSRMLVEHLIRLATRTGDGDIMLPEAKDDQDVISFIHSINELARAIRVLSQKTKGIP